MKKRGLSGVIGVVAILFMIVIAVVLVWVLVSKSLEGVRESINSKIIFNNVRLKIVEESVYVNGTNVTFLVERAPGGGEIVGFLIVLKDDKGNSFVSEKYKTTEIVEFQRVRVEIFDVEHNLEKISIIEVYGIIETEDDTIISEVPLGFFDVEKPRRFSGGGGGGGGSSNNGDSDSPEDPVISCGDGIVNQMSEQCDDGNNIDGDRCSSLCQNELLDFIDLDNDKMDDNWESITGLNNQTNDAGFDPDNDLLLNIEEYIIDINEDILQEGSNPLVFDNSIDSDGDGFSNLVEKSDPKRTDPTNPESYPGDLNLVSNPGITWFTLGAGGLFPSGWAKRGESLPNHSVGWISDPSDPGRNIVLTSNNLGDAVGNSFGWRNDFLSVVVPDTWYEASVDIATNNVAPVLNPIDNSMIIDNDYGILVKFPFYNHATIRNNNNEIRGSEVSFQSKGILMSDFDESNWTYRTFSVRPFEDWRTLSKYVKSPTNVLSADINTYNFIRGTGYFDNFKFVQKSNDPGKIPLKKSGTLEFVQYKGEDYFPIYLHGFPDKGSGKIDLQEVKDAGFNTVFYGSSTYTYSNGTNININPFKNAVSNLDLAVVKKFQDTYTTNYTGIQTDIWFNDPSKIIPYGNWPYGKSRMLDDVQTWNNFENLLAFEVGWDEIECNMYTTGTWIESLEVQRTVRDYIHSNGKLAFGNYCRATVANTGDEEDKILNYYPLLDMISTTNNLIPAYAFSNNTAELQEFGEKMRRSMKIARDNGIDNYYMSFGLGHYCWSGWNGEKADCEDNNDQIIPFNLQRFQVFDQLINGAVWVGFPGTGNGVDLDDPNFAYHWEQISAISREINSLIPILLEPEFYDEWNVSDSRVEIMMKKHSGKIYLFADSAHYQDISNVQITINGNTINSVKAINEITNGDINNPINRSISININGVSFNDNFHGDSASSPAGVATPGYATHVYEITCPSNCI